MLSKKGGVSDVWDAVEEGFMMGEQEFNSIGEGWTGEWRGDRDNLVEWDGCTG